MNCDICGNPMDPKRFSTSCHECLTLYVVNSVPDEEEGSCRNCGEVPDECSCGPRDEDDAAPEECDYVTKDDASCSLMKFHEYGTGKKLLFVNPDKTNWVEAVKAHMDKEQFWPSVWFLSDHGNWTLLRLSDG